MIVDVYNCPFCHEEGPLRQTDDGVSSTPQIGGIYVHEVDLNFTSISFFVKCATCQAQGPEEITARLAVKKWNLVNRLPWSRFELNIME